MHQLVSLYHQQDAGFKFGLNNPDVVLPVQRTSLSIARDLCFQKLSSRFLSFCSLLGQCVFSILSSDLSPKNYDSFGLFLPKCKTLHFSKFSLILQALVYSVTATRSFCILLTSTSLRITDSSFELSENSFFSHKAVTGKSFMYTAKKSDPRQGLETPTSTSDNSDTLLLTTLCLRSFKKSSNQL